MARRTVLAIDLGAESGRVMAVQLDDRRLTVTELHRFANVPVQVCDTLTWDILQLWHQIQQGIELGRRLQPASLGVDAWGVDFALLDAQGELIGNPVHYRDRRTAGVFERVLARCGREWIFEQTGIQFMPINTLYQLASLVERDAPQLRIAHTLLTIPDLINYWLTGTRVCEFTNATTTQLFDPRRHAWADPLIAALGLPRTIFAPIVAPGTHLGRYADIAVIAPACHDTGSAVAAVPMTTPRAAYISSGTWSLVGVEVRAPVINAAALAANLTNEGGVGDRYRLLKNVMGLWIVQQCRATWAAQGHTYSYAELTQLAQSAPPLQALIDPDDARFLPPGDHPALIQELCAATGQPVPQSHGAIVRCVLESLALAYRHVLDTIATLTGQPIEVVHIVGGGCRNTALCQFTADATGLPVIAGPAEATVLGNALVQLIALGEVRDLGEARQLVAQLDEQHRYEPRAHADWETAYHRFRALYRA